MSVGSVVCRPEPEEEQMRFSATFALAAYLVAVASGPAFGQVPDFDQCTVDDDLQDYYLECFRTCPAGDTHTYDHFRITVRDFWGDPIPDIPVADFSFSVVGGDLSFAPMDGYVATTAEGVIEFSITANRGVAHPEGVSAAGAPLDITVYVLGLELSQHLVITCRTFDYNLDDVVDPVDLAKFASHLFLDAVDGDAICSDFDEDGGVIDPADLGMFAAHFGHRHSE